MQTKSPLLSAAVAALVLVLLQYSDHAIALRIPSPNHQQQGPHQAQQHAATSSKPQPPVWPEQFKAVMLQNRTDNLALVTLYYDWKLKANLNIIASQLGARGTIWDLEWNNVSTVYCRVTQCWCSGNHHPPDSKNSV
jgi:hypothetical protein